MMEGELFFHVEIFGQKKKKKKVIALFTAPLGACKLVQEREKVQEEYQDL